MKKYESKELVIEHDRVKAIVTSGDGKETAVRVQIFPLSPGHAQYEFFLRRDTLSNLIEVLNEVVI